MKSDRQREELHKQLNQLVRRALASSGYTNFTRYCIVLKFLAKNIMLFRLMTNQDFKISIEIVLYQRCCFCQESVT